MVTLLVITAIWLGAAILIGVGVGRVIARAETDVQTAELEREHRALLALH